MSENKIALQDADRRARDYAIGAIGGTSHLSEGIKQSGQKILNFGRDDHNPDIINNGRALINLADSI